MAVPKLDLSDAYAKLARGREHIAEAQKAINAFLSTDFYKLRLEVDKTEGRMKLFFDSLHQPDKHVNTVIGDSISNLRSALDYAVVALIAPITGKRESIGFPFADDIKGFTGEVTKGALSVGTKTILDFFINEVQAYKGGRSEPLWVLNKLRNIDKHRLLIATVEMASLKMSFRMGGITVIDSTMGVRAGQGCTLVDAPADGHIEITDKPKPAFEVRLTEPPYIEKASAVSFLNSVASDVKRFLDAFAVLT